MKLAEMQPIATTIYNQLKPHCEEGFIHIAGGIRRKKSDPHDIEIVCSSKKIELSEDMFQTEKRMIPAQGFVDTVNKMQKLSGDAYGRYTKRLYEYEDYAVQVDIFMPQKEDYFRQYAIRTGSNNYSAGVIAPAWVRQGWRGTEDGLRLELECIQGSSTKWTCIAKEPKLPPIWRSEREFFEWLRIPYIEPEKRI